MTDPVFFAPSRRYTAAEVANLTGSVLVDSGHVRRFDRGTRAGQRGRRECARLCRRQAQFRADAVTAGGRGSVSRGICQQGAGRRRRSGPSASATGLRFGRPTAVSGGRHAGPMTGETGISPHAHIDPPAHVEAGAIIEAGAVDRAGRLRSAAAPSSRRMPLSGQSCQIGRDGYRRPGRQHPVCADRQPGHHPWRRQDRPGRLRLRRRAKGPERVPQIGRVVIQDDVEIGANTTIDRGAMSRYGDRRGHQDRQSGADRP